MLTEKPKTVRLEDYEPPNYLIERVELRFELGEDATIVRSKLAVVRNRARGSDNARSWALDGRDLELLELRLDGAVLAPERYSVDAKHLLLSQVPDAFQLEVTTRIYPQNNTSLEGLFQSSGNFCTQCEAEGFRRITYFSDRPDVMAAYTVTVVADKTRYPVLLSNGDRVTQGEQEDGRHWVTWVDPFKKPCYLFALVAGRLERVTDRFVTRSGREISLEIYVEPGNAGQCDHALQSLKKAMAWDEMVYGREYDLDTYMIVAVGDFNMGAMENKGLNIFNTKYVLAEPETATDVDYKGIEGVIAHEYFHNWTGNRVTCRDWFQLSLKEGLTVFRDQEFSADMGLRGVKRIGDVGFLRATQFPQDAGPMAHPVRPRSYIEINNFYTVTVYNKGAEVVRMLHRLLGEAGFRRGMDLYFQRHDGHAVTTDDFVQAMEDATGVSLVQFRRWYDQAGTPQLEVNARYDPVAKVYTVGITQSCPPTPGQPRKAPFHIPVALGLMDRAGRDLPLQLEGEAGPGEGTRVLELREFEHVFRFVNVPEAPTLSLLRGFSAPVKLKLPSTDADLMFRLAHDSDSFNRWEAGQELATRVILHLVEALGSGTEWHLADSYSEAFQRVITAPDLDAALRAEALTLPCETYLGEQMVVIDVDGIHEARKRVQGILARRLRDAWLALYEANGDEGEYRPDAASIGRRLVKNRALEYLMQLDEPRFRALCLAQFQNASNMTDQLSALGLLVNCDCPERGESLAWFYERWQHEALVVDKWFALQATSRLPGTLEEVGRLLQHPAFSIKNPNKVRSLIGAFCQLNPVQFHRADGAGYEFLVDRVLALNSINPQIAARLLSALAGWRKHDETRQGLARAQLERVLGAPKLSADVYEIAAKSLDN